MTTKQLAEKIVNITGTPEKEQAAYEQLLIYLISLNDGYAPTDNSRIKARDRARRENYFWIPCIFCGEWYAGFEMIGPAVPLTAGQAIGVCASTSCKEEAKKLKEKFPAGLLESVPF